MARTYHHGSKWNWKKGPPRKQRTHLLYDKVFWKQKEPRWWRKIFKHRKRRAELRRCLSELKKGRDSENMSWPKDKQPWMYFW